MAADGRLGLIVASGFLAGLIGAACATSDAMLEKKRRQDAMLGSGERCYSGVTAECYTGKKGTAGRGACKLGEHTCNDGIWSSCEGQVLPAEETCNKVDDDCDGQTDEDSVPSSQAECTTGKAGVCNAGTNKCIKGQVKCVQDVQPGAEICNGLDDDCDGDVDNDCASEEEAARAGAN